MSAVRIGDDAAMAGYVSPHDRGVWYALARAVLTGQVREARKQGRLARKCSMPPGAYHVGSDYHRLCYGVEAVVARADLVALADHARAVEAEMKPRERPAGPLPYRADIDG